MAQYYAGLDVSMDLTDISTVDENGKIVFEASVKTDPQSIDNALKTAGFPIQKMSLESGSWSHWLVRELSSMGWNITCVDARSISPLLALKTNKTDRNDARGIAEAVRTQSQYVREVYQRSQESIDLGTLLTARRMLVEQRTALGNTMRGLLKSFGINLGSLSSNKISAKVDVEVTKYWPSISDPLGTKIHGVLPKDYPVLAFEALSRCFTFLLKEIDVIDATLGLLAKKDELIKRLMTVPGVGPLTAITYKVIIDNPRRFKAPRLVGAYLGMCPKQYSSGRVKRQGRISKKGSHELRTLLASAGMKILTHCKKDSSLKTWGIKLAEKHGKKKAAVAIGRKMAIIMHHIWTKNTVFQSGEK